MARTKKLPSVVIDYDGLSNEVKGIYDKFSVEYSRENIYTLRDKAVGLAVESPTTLSKDELVKRMTDKLISLYFPLETKNEVLPAWGMVGTTNGERVKGFFESHDKENRIGKIVVPAALVKEYSLRSGDIVEGFASDVMSVKTLTVINSVDGELPRRDRKNFEDMQVVSRRKFGSLITGTTFGEVLPEAEMGERVILSNMTRATANQFLQSVPHSVGLFVGVEPESEAALGSSFVINFDATKEQALYKARLALERVKRLCEWGKDVVFVIHGFDALGDRDIERALFGAGRCFETGSVTVIADVNKDKEFGIFGKIATTIIE